MSVSMTTDTLTAAIAPLTSVNVVMLSANSLRIKRVELELPLHLFWHTGLEGRGSWHKENCQPNPQYRPDNDGDGKHKAQFSGGAPLWREHCHERETFSRFALGRRIPQTPVEVPETTALLRRILVPFE